MNNPSAFTNGIASVALGGYLAAVVYQGNTRELFTLVREELPFVEWMIAFLILYWFARTESTSDIGKPLITISFIALALIAFQRAPRNIFQRLKEYGDGDISLYELLTGGTPN